MKAFRLLICGLALASLNAVPAQGQEAAANSPFNNDTARLNTRVESVRGMTESLGGTVDQMLECQDGAQYWDKSEQACKDMVPQTLYDCASQGLLFTGSVCVDPAYAEDVKRMAGCSRVGKFWNGSYAGAIGGNASCFTDPEIARLEDLINELRRDLTQVDNRVIKLEDWRTTVNERLAEYNIRINEAQKDANTALDRTASIIACGKKGHVWTGSICREADIAALNQSIECQIDGKIYKNANQCHAPVAGTPGFDTRTEVVCASHSGSGDYVYDKAGKKSSFAGSGLAAGQALTMRAACLDGYIVVGCTGGGGTLDYNPSNADSNAGASVLMDGNGCRLTAVKPNCGYYRPLGQSYSSLSLANRGEWQKVEARCMKVN